MRACRTLVGTGDGQAIEQIQDEGDQGVQGAAAPGYDIMQIQLPGAPAALVRITVAAHYALAHHFSPVNGSLFVHIAMGYPVIILITKFAGMVFRKGLQTMGVVFEFGEGRKKQLHEKRPELKRSEFYREFQFAKLASSRGVCLRWQFG